MMHVNCLPPGDADDELVILWFPAYLWAPLSRHSCLVRSENGEMKKMLQRVLSRVMMICTAARPLFCYIIPNG
jgi:hypothetical protein